MAEVFMSKIVQEIAKTPSAERVLREAATKVAQERFDTAVQELKDDFDSNPVTQEIEGGLRASNKISETLKSRSPTENLFAFIGFDAGDKPIKEIRERLDPSHPQGPKLRQVGKDTTRNSIRYQFKASTPDEKALWNATPLPRAPGLSWAQKIETGIQGFQSFLARDGKGYSGGGIQAKIGGKGGKDVPVQKVREEEYVPPRGGYIQTMFQKFLERMKRK